MVARVRSVRQGESVETIAAALGFAPETIWDHPDNATLKAARGDMRVLAPGDELFVPEVRAKTQACATDQLHRFRRKGIPLELDLVIRDVEGEPRADLAYALRVGREVREGKTGGDGRLKEWIDPRITQVTLELEGEPPLSLALHAVDPIEMRSGVVARLMNLGLLPAARPDGEALADALRRFQAQEDLDRTGEADDATRDALVRVHRS